MVINIAEPINFEIHKIKDNDATLYKLTKSSVIEDQRSIKLNLQNFHVLNVPSLIDVNKHQSLNENEFFSLKTKEKTDSIIQYSRVKGKSTLEAIKKDKKKRVITICTVNCKYDVVKRIAAQIGMKEVSDDTSWNLYWTDSTIGIERIKDMKRFQKINHFPGMTEICRKDFLARNLKRMVKLFPKDYNFFPKTWCFPSDLGDALEFAKNKRSKIYILKPYAGSQGRGIFLTRNLKDLKINERMICQLYITKPYTIDGFKFDLRVYALITSCDPLRIYVYNDGLARFATSKYKIVTDVNMMDVYMHLTNYTINKNSDTYIMDEECGSKRTFSALNKWWKNHSVNVNEIWNKIDEIIVKTIIAALPTLKHNYNVCFPNHDLIYACFELLGFDILLDWKLKPYLLEVNHSPSLHTDSKVDKQVKELLLIDTFEILNLMQYSKKKIIEEDKKRVTERLWKGIHKEISANDASSVLTKIDKNAVRQKQFIWENTHLGNFRRVYPSEDCEKYKPFFNQSGSSVFQETVASKAHEEAIKQQKEEYDFKIKEESRRVICKTNDSKTTLESVNPGLAVNLNKVKTKLQINKPFTIISRRMSNANFSYNFEPDTISEDEEKERLASMSERMRVLRSFNILNIVYMSLKHNSILTPKDKSKYGPFFEPKKSEYRTKLPERRIFFGPSRRK